MPLRDRDDAVQVGRLAILEAYVTHDGRALLSTWVRRVVHWRLSEARRRRPSNEEFPGTVEPVLNGAGLEGVLHVREVRRWLLAEVDQLPTPRQQAIVSALLDGESMADIARSLGLAPATVYRELDEVQRRIRRRCKLGLTRPPGISTLWDDDLGNL